MILILLTFLNCILPGYNQVIVGNASKADLKISVTGVKSNDGVVRLAVFSAPEGFPNEHTRASKLGVFNARKDKLFVRMKDLPFGKHAVVAYHDINNNNKLDVNLVGYPIEPYGVSNNARRRFSPPVFDEARFTHQDSLRVLTIELK